MSIFLRAISIGVLASILLFFGLQNFYQEITPVVADEKFQTIHIFPSEAISDDWEDSGLATIQNLSDDAIFNEFDPSNSAYIVSERYFDNYLIIASASDSIAKPEATPIMSPPTPPYQAGSW